MDPVLETFRRGGVVRSRTLLDAGVTEYALSRARREGRLQSVRKGWVAIPDADPKRVEAARRGVVISCVTVAARQGLWVPESKLVHVAVPPHSGRSVRTARMHWSMPVVPRPPDACEDGIENALALVATCQPFETALVIWESALNKGLIDALAMARLDLPLAARNVLERARPFADSGLETIVIHRLRWLRLPMLPQAWICGHRVDLLIGDRLVVQIDGGHHVGAQRTSDIAHDAELVLRGYHVLRFSYEQIMERWHEVQAVIMEAIAQGLHRAG